MKPYENYCIRFFFRILIRIQCVCLVRPKARGFFFHHIRCRIMGTDLFYIYELWTDIHQVRMNLINNTNFSLITK